MSSQKLYPRMPTFEVYTCFLMWTSCTLYSCYSLYLDIKRFRFMLPSQDFDDGLPMFGRKRDISDFEWSVWSSFFITLIPWVIVYIILGQIIRITLPKLRPLFFIGISLSCLTFTIGTKPTLFLLLQPLLIYPTSLFKKKWLCWIVTLLILISFNLTPLKWVKELMVEPESDVEYMISVMFAWMNTRCLIFCLTKCDTAVHLKGVKSEFLILFLYSFYFPLLFTGPIMMYEDFEKGYNGPPMSWNKRTIFFSITNWMRYIFWFIFNEAVVHFLYFNALQYHPGLVENLSLWSLCGLGYAMSQFFMTKYAVMYGIPNTVCKMEGFEAPRKPKCISRIHLYSQMWKYFDQGLYQFLKNFIYLPIIGDKQKQASIFKKLFASAVSFTFVFIWHGIVDYIFVWALLNLIGIIIEGIGTMLSQTRMFIKFCSYLSPSSLRRFKGLIATPLLIMSALSSFYFFFGLTVANIFVQKIIIDVSLKGFLCIFGALYCMCQVSMEVQNWEIQRHDIKLK